MKRFFDPRNKSFSRMTALFGVLLFFVFGMFFVSHVVLAGPTALQQAGTAAGVAPTSLPLLIARIIRVVLSILGIITVILIIYAGFMYMGAHGDPAKVDKAKKIITQTVIGLIIILSSYSIASFIIGKLMEAMNGPGTITSITKKYIEPLAGSLGAGIVESHYPMRNAVDVPRNTKIFVTFKQKIKPESIIDGYVAGCTYVVTNPQTPVLCSTKLIANAVAIYESAKNPETTKLARKEVGKDHSDEVVVTVDQADFKTFVFKPKDYLGNANTNTNYNVSLKNILKADGSAAFSGANSGGYGWSFTVSTTADLTPPKIVSVIPFAPAGGKVENKLDRNITVEITFDEAMDPLASTGIYSASVCSTTSKPCGENNDDACSGTCSSNTKQFQHIKTVSDADSSIVRGRYEISNAYKTVDFTTASWCGKDPCGGNIYCLPALKDITVSAIPASIDLANPPQGILTGVNYDGLVDAAGNSLDGNGDNKACQVASDAGVCKGLAKTDDYTWHFSTTNNVNDTPPKVELLDPGTGASNPAFPGNGVGNIDLSKAITIKFDALLKASTVNSQNVALLPQSKDLTKTLPDYPMWFTSETTNLPAPTVSVPNPTQKSVISLNHPIFIAAADGGHDYWTTMNQDVKSAYQICMYPAQATVASDAGACTGQTPATPYCCNGKPMKKADFDSSCPLPTHCSDGSWIEKTATCPVLCPNGTYAADLTSCK